MKTNIRSNTPTRSRKLKVLIATLLVLVLAVAALVTYDLRQATFGTLYIATVGKIRMLSQRLATSRRSGSCATAAMPSRRR
jgi:hypothetical protein